MADYRIYRLSIDDNILGGADARCFDDRAALDLAQRLTTSGNASEVWVGTRLVGRVKSQNTNDIVQQSKVWMDARE